MTIFVSDTFVINRIVFALRINIITFFSDQIIKIIRYFHITEPQVSGRNYTEQQTYKDYYQHRVFKGLFDLSVIDLNAAADKNQYKTGDKT